MRDMIPPGERSIRNISVSEVHRGARHGAPPEDMPHRETPKRPRQRLGGTFWILALVVAGIAILGAVLLSTTFAGAAVTVFPRTETLPIGGTLTAHLNPAAGQLGYQTITVRRNATTTATASGTKEVSRQASGSITIFNNFSTANQLLIANTRFEAPDGKIYRIKESVTVPGATKKEDGSLTKSSAVATVYADSPGEAYNRAEPTTFKIPGFKGDPRYEGFSAESKGPIQGGFVGTEPSVPAEELERAETALKLELETSVRAAVITEMPDGFMPIPGTLSLVYGSTARTASGESARLSQDVTATAAVIREADLAAAIAAQLVEGYRGEAIGFVDKGAVTIEQAPLPEDATEGALYLKLSGSPTLLWQFEGEAVKQALRGVERSKLQEVLDKFPAVASAEASLRPFWHQNFPDNPDKITVTAGSLAE